MSDHTPGVARRPDGVAVVTLDAPGRRANVLGPELADALAGTIEQLADDDAVRAIVLASGKAASFLVGADVAALAAITTRAEAVAFCRRGQQAVERLATARKPVVAAVHGPAVAAGFEVALACGAIVASDDPRTSVGLPQVTVGLLPALDGLPRLAARIGVRRALELALEGAIVPAGRARVLGLIDALAPRESLIDAAARRALSLAAGSRRATSRPRRSSLRDVALELNPVGLRVLFARARRAAQARTRGDHPAEPRIVEVLEASALRGREAAREAAAIAFGDLLVTDTSRRLVELFVAEARLGGPPADDEAPATTLRDRLLAPVLDEVRLLLAEGATPTTIDAALVDWGYAARPGGLLAAVRAATSAAGGASTFDAAPPRVRREEIQLRCALRLAGEALAALADGMSPTAAAIDVRAVRDLGFPRFRGGPLRWLDDVGPDEIVRRLRGFEVRAGPRADRWAPPRLLVELAASGGRVRDGCRAP